MNGEVLWAPWRVEYVRGPKGQGCIFCEATRGRDDRENLVLHRARHAFLILNRYPYTAGHLMVVPHRHVASPEDLTPEEVADLWALLVRAKAALQAEMNPQGYNVGFNLGPAAGAGVKDHMHLHVVPRWSGDTNFMAVLGEVRVISQHLDEIFDALSGRLAAEPQRPGAAQPSSRE